MHSVSPRSSPKTLKDSLPSVLKSHTQQGNDHLHASENQDRHLFHFDEVRHLLWMGVFDGHSGSRAAEFLTIHILDNVNRFLERKGEYETRQLVDAMRKGILLTEEQFHAEEEADGACVLLVCLSGMDMVIANLGDSRAVLGRLSPASSNVIEAQQLTNDHNASNPVEARRARFRFLRNIGRLPETARLEEFTEEGLIELVKENFDGEDIIENGRLITVQLTRSFGDFPSKRICYGVISNEPEFTVMKLDKHCHILLLASDGIWATLSNQNAIEMAFDRLRNLSAFYHGSNSPAQQIVEEAVLMGSGDDQTCLLLNLKNYLHTIKLRLRANGIHDEDEGSPLLQSILNGVFFSHRGTSLASIMNSSATRPFTVKLADLNKRGSFISSTEPSKFEEVAKRVQASASDAHRHSKSKQGRAGPPIASSSLSLFEEQAAQVTKERERDKRKGREEVESLNVFSQQPSIWDEDAKRTQMSASEVHRHSKSKLGRAGPPLASPDLGLHERRCVEIQRSRSKGDKQFGFRAWNN